MQDLLADGELLNVVVQNIIHVIKRRTSDYCKVEFKLLYGVCGEVATNSPSASRSLQPVNRISQSVSRARKLATFILFVTIIRLYFELYMKRMLGSCYYPEHWSTSFWKEHARRIAGRDLIG